MKIANTAPLHLSNYEVLTHLLSLKAENDHLQSLINSRTTRKARFVRSQYPLKEDRGKTFDDSAILDEEDTQAEDEAERRGVSDDLIWVQDQTIKYLCSDYNPTARQTPEGVAELADGLQDHGLTKGEILQIVNLAPVEQVELYCVIEEVDTRYRPDPSMKLSEIGEQVAATLLYEPPSHLGPYITRKDGSHGDGEGDDGHGHGRGYVDDGDYRMAVEEEAFVHEADWGKDKEEGIGEERENDME